MHEANIGFNKFCGPAVLSIMTGRDSDECAYRISCINGQHKITGVSLTDLKAAGMQMGVQFSDLPAFVGRSVYFTASIICKLNGLYLAVVSNHYIMLEVKDGVISLCDNHTKTPIDLKNSARLSQKVHRLLKVDNSNVQKPEPKPPEPVEINHSFDVKSAHGVVTLFRISHLDNGTNKHEVIGSFCAYEQSLQEIAFKIMELADKER